MDELLIMAFIRMLGESAVSIERLPNGYCGDNPHNCEICSDRPWWKVTFKNVGPITIGWRKRVINIDWSETGHSLDPDKINEREVTKSSTMIHAYGYAEALSNLTAIIHMIRIQKRDRERELSHLGRICVCGHHEKAHSGVSGCIFSYNCDCKVYVCIQGRVGG